MKYRPHSKIVVLFITIILFISAAVLPAAAQQSQSQEYLAQRQAMASQLYQQGIGLLEKYGLPPETLNDVLPHIANNDQQSLLATLADYGLSEGEIGSLLGEAAPLIEQGMSSGIIQDYVAQQGLAAMQEAELDQGFYDNVLLLLDDPEALAAYLAEMGMASGDIDAFVEDMTFWGELGLDPVAFDEYVQFESFLTALEEAGIPEDEWDAYADGWYSGDVEAMLEEAGANLDEFYAAWDDSYFAAYEDLGFDEESYNDLMVEIDEALAAEGEDEVSDESEAGQDDAEAVEGEESGEAEGEEAEGEESAG